MNHTCRSTEFAIDKHMLDFTSKCIGLIQNPSSGVKINGRDGVELERPEGFSEMPKDDRQLIMDQINLANEELSSVERNIVQWGVDYQMAAVMSQFDRFWLVWKVDQRGRFVCTTIRTSAGDHIRALFSFANKKPITVLC